MRPKQRQEVFACTAAAVAVATAVAILGLTTITATATGTTAVDGSTTTTTTTITTRRLRRRSSRRTRYIPDTGNFVANHRAPQDLFLSDGVDMEEFEEDLRQELFSSMPPSPTGPSPTEPTPPSLPPPSPTRPPTPAPTEPERTPEPTPMVVPTPTSESPTSEPPAEPPTREDRDLEIQLKCGVTALERSRDILTELLMVSDPLTLVDPNTPQFQARIWLDDIDEAIICPENNRRVHQRYRLALLYFQMGGGDWTVCNAVEEDEDNPAASKIISSSSFSDAIAAGGTYSSYSGQQMIGVYLDVPASERTPYRDAFAERYSTSAASNTGISSISSSNVRSMPSAAAKDIPSGMPSDMPSLVPSDMPSIVPSQSPTTSPTFVVNTTAVSLAIPSASKPSSSSVSLSSRQATCPGTPFLSVQNECEWYGMVCTSDYDPQAGNMLDEYFPLVVLDLSSNNLNGELFDELYGFERLERLSFRSNGGVSGNISSSIGELSMTLVELDLGGNQITGTLPDSLFELSDLTSLILFSNQLNGTISSAIENLDQLNELQLQRNEFTGTIPDDGLLTLEELIVLSIQENGVSGTLEPLCEVRDERRESFEEYLSVIESDCNGDPPPVECSCCLCFP